MRPQYLTARSLVCLIPLAMGCRVGFEPVAGRDGDVDDTPPSQQVEISVQGHGVALIAGGEPCADRCLYDGAVEVSAWAGEGWELASFSGSCAGAGPCTALAGTSVALTFRQAPITANIVFVTSVDAPKTGLAALDALCAERAAVASLPGSYVAFVSTSNVDARARIGSARGWVRVDGLPVFDTIVDIPSTTPLRGVALTELGALRSDFVMTGSTTVGARTGNECANWTSTAGSVDGGRSDWSWFYALGNSGAACSTSSPVYCFGTSQTQPVSLAPAPAPMGRYVFVTPDSYPVGGGIAAADARCASDASAASLPGSYRAVLATTTQSAGDHIGGTAGLWRRPDGVVVSFAGLDAPSLDAVIMVDAAGAVSQGNDTLFGATSLTALGTATCDDWTSSTAPLRIDVLTISSAPFLRGGTPPSCASGARLMCAQAPP